MKTCIDFPGECCDSCHDDVDEGVGYFVEVEDPDGELFARVCCKKTDAAETALEETCR